ncbi:MAG: hypothetical protein LJE56_03490 [Acidiferrobacterales bacterium]|jgi:hypothetical protein|nr:hypothetical protein [Acidiferrobacterales bacterium]
MSNMAINDMINTTRDYFNVPATPRGRALHTLDWFMNGKRTLNFYDDTSIKFNDVRGK